MQEVELRLAAVCQPLAEDAAGADADLALENVEATAEGIRVGVEEKGDTIPLIVTEYGQGGERYGGQEKADQDEHMPYPRARHNHHPHPDGAEDDRRTHVRLRHDQRRRQRRQRQRSQEDPHACDLMLSVGQEAGEGDDREQLGDL